jgi:molecular chaperone DnaK (HSP70)
LGHGQRFLICDAGGGTVDLIVFEIDDSGERRALKEVTKGLGDSCGSTFLDIRMREYLKDRFYHHGKVSDTAMESMMETFIDTIKVNNGKIGVYKMVISILLYKRTPLL